MANTRPCKYCDNPVARNAKRCPKCGGKHPFPVKPGEMLGGLIIVAALVLTVLTCCVWLPNRGERPPDPTSSSQQSIQATDRDKNRPQDQPRALPESVYATPTLWDQMMAGTLGQVVLLGSNQVSAGAKKTYLEFNDREAVMKLAVRGDLFPVSPGQRLLVEGEYSGGLIVKVDGGSHGGRRGFIPAGNYSLTPP